MGVLIAWTGGAFVPLVIATATQLLFAALLVGLPAREPHAEPRTLHHASDLLAGFRFIRRNPVFLAAITLDLLAVLLAGAVALLPVYAKDILHVGPAGLGWLRTAASLGALLMSLAVTRLPPFRAPGRVLLRVVAGFGLATVGFGLSRNFAFSMGCLMLIGALDMVSVVIRITLEQNLTPDPLRGRVSAINFLFVGFSNELGAFESGAAGDRFHAPDACGNASLCDHLEQAYAAGSVNVSPHSSRLNPGISTTRTRSWYFSPNRATAPDCIAWC